MLGTVNWCGTRPWESAHSRQTSDFSHEVTNVRGPHVRCLASQETVILVQKLSFAALQPK